jgi:hypothetical protein
MWLKSEYIDLFQKYNDQLPMTVFLLYFGRISSITWSILTEVKVAAPSMITEK